MAGAFGSLRVHPGAHDETACRPHAIWASGRPRVIVMVAVVVGARTGARRCSPVLAEVTVVVTVVVAGVVIAGEAVGFRVFFGGEGVTAPATKTAVIAVYLRLRSGWRISCPARGAVA